MCKCPDGFTPDNKKATPAYCCAAFEKTPTYGRDPSGIAGQESSTSWRLRMWVIMQSARSRRHFNVIHDASNTIVFTGTWLECTAFIERHIKKT